MPEVSFQGVTKRFDTTEVLRTIDLDIDKGEFVILLGPSGCGKSTTLRILAGLEAPSSGRVFMRGLDITDVPPRERDLAMVFQSYALYPHLTVRENLAFGPKIRGMAKQEIRTRIEEAASILGLVELLDRKPRELSGGQRQRVAMGRAIVKRPSVFLFDEPLSNLDAGLRTQMRAEIAALHRRFGATTLYVTHDQVEAMTLGSRLVILHEGVVQQVGPPLEVYARPANLFVGGFLGAPAMNQVLGRVVPGGDRQAPCFEAAGLRLPLGERASALIGRPVVAGFRPQAVKPCADGALRGEVEIVETMGSESFVRVRIEAERITARIAGRPDYRLGEPAAFNVDAASIHLFSAEGESVLAASS